MFILIARNLGLNVNGDAFFEMAKSIPLSVIRKIQHDDLNLEALLFGQARLINADMNEYYGQGLW